MSTFPAATLDHVGVFLPSLDDGVELFHDKLGLASGECRDTEALRIAFLDAGPARIELVEALDGSVQAPRIDHIAFRVDDLDATIAALGALGIETTPPRQAPGRR